MSSSGPKPGSSGVLSARRDAMVLAVLITAVLMLIWNGSTFFSHLRVEGGNFAGDVRVASTALTLNVALILFGWRRYIDLQHEAEVRAQQERRAALLATTDPATGLYNRKGFADSAEGLCGSAGGRGGDLVVISFQIHRFRVRERPARIQGSGSGSEVHRGRAPHRAQRRDQSAV